MLIRSRFRPILVCWNIKRALLEITIRESKGNTLRFNQVKNLETNITEVLRFTWIVIRLTQPMIVSARLLRPYNQTTYVELKNSRARK